MLQGKQQWATSTSPTAHGVRTSPRDVWRGKESLSLAVPRYRRVWVEQASRASAAFRRPWLAALLVQQATVYAHTCGRNNWPLRVATTQRPRLRRSSRTNPGEHSPSFCSTTAGVVSQPSAFPRTPVESIHCRADGRPDRLDFSSLILRRRLTNQRLCCMSSPLVPSEVCSEIAERKFE
jgi:hypothetical protein